jgi:hypothetical protein
VVFVLIFSFVGGVEPFLPPLEEPAVCELCVCGWFPELVVKLLVYHMFSFPLCIACIWHGICNMMYRHICILGCLHFVSYALFRKSFSYILCSQ